MADDRPDDNEILEAIEHRALLGMGEEERGDDIDVIAELRGGAGPPIAPDLTLGGYVEVHERVPAFEGGDGQPYTVDIAIDSTGDPDKPFAAFLVFVRWAATGAGIMDHVETGDVASGATEADARRAALDLSLYEVKAELDAAIERKRQELED